MNVILLERIARLGGIGDVVKVKNGYGRNFLIPNKKALRASEQNIKLFEERRHIIEQQNAESKAAAEAIASKMSGIKMNIVRQASQEGKLYGSVSVRDIAEALKEAGYDVPKSQIIMSGAIKTTGEYTVRVTLHAEVVVTIPVNIVRLEIEAA